MEQSEARLSYVEFRREIISDLVDSVRAEPDTFTFRRELICGFRFYLADNVEKLIRISPLNEHLVRVGLKIPPEVNFRNTTWNRLVRSARSLIYRFLGQPRFLNQQKFGGVISDIRKIKTFEGRRTVFDLFPELRYKYYSPALDFCCLRMKDINDIADIKNVSLGREDIIRAIYRMGIRSISEINELVDDFPEDISFGVLDILIELGLISTADDLTQLKCIPRRYSKFFRQNDLIGLRKVISTLKSIGCSDMQALHALNCTCSSNIENLDKNIFLLKKFGVLDIGQVFEHVDDLLWHAPPSKWEYLLAVLSLNLPLEIAAFKDILRSSESPSIELALYLKSKCSSALELEMFIPILLKCKGSFPSVIERCDTFLGAPFNLTITDLPGFETYLTTGGPDYFHDFLKLQQQYFDASKRSLSAFQILYQKRIPINFFMRLLQIVATSKFNKNQKNSLSWMIAFHKAHQYSDSICTMEYIVDTIQIQTFDQYFSTLPLCAFDKYLICYLIEEKKIGTLWSLLDWYKLHGKFTRKFLLLSVYPGISNCLLDDAFQRQDFSFVERNWKVINQFIDDKVRFHFQTYFPRLENGLPYYNEAVSFDLKRNMAETLQDKLPRMLNFGGGFLLKSLLVAALDDDGSDHNTVSSVFDRNVDSLLNGAGPTSIDINLVEIDAIERVYGVLPEFISSYWKEVTNFEFQIETLKRQSNYKVSWKHEEQISTIPADIDLVAAIEKAIAWYQAQSPNTQPDILNAIDGLRPRTDKDLSIEPKSLYFHFAILLAVCAGDERVETILSCFLESRASLDERKHAAFVLWHNLKKLFVSSLPDVLSDRARIFVTHFSGDQAQHLAKRLIKFDQPSTFKNDGHTALDYALRISRQMVTDTFNRAIVSELKKFNPSGNDSSSNNEFSVVVSKHPAAFFSKSAAGLCTDKNTKMWREERHCHLLIFDNDSKKLVGMAMLYVMSLPQIYALGKGLLIRAINPVGDVMDTFNVSSIVDSLIQVAIDIAKLNQLAYVAIPNCHYADVISNSSRVEDDIYKRYGNAPGTINDPRPFRSRFNRSVNYENYQYNFSVDKQTQPFYAFEHGVTPIQQFFVVWHSINSPEVDAS